MTWRGSIQKQGSADSRVGIAGGRSQQGGIACGQHVQCDGAGRGSVALTGSRHHRYPPPPLQLPAWTESLLSRSRAVIRLRAVVKTLESFGASRRNPEMKSVICVSYCKPGLGDPLTPLTTELHTHGSRDRESGYSRKPGGLGCPPYVTRCLLSAALRFLSQIFSFVRSLRVHTKAVRGVPLDPFFR